MNAIAVNTTVNAGMDTTAVISTVNRVVDTFQHNVTDTLVNSTMTITTDATMGGNSTNTTQEPAEVDEVYEAHLKALTTAMKAFLATNMAVGLIGNSLSLAVFTRSRLSGVPSSGFLAALAVVDSGTLVMAFTYEMLQPVSEVTRVLYCLVLPYFMEVSMFLSAWFVVAFTVERYVAVCHPLHAPRILAKVKERWVVGILALLACTLYSYFFWAKNLDHVCEYQGGDLDYFTRLTGSLRFGFSFALPFVLIAIFNIGIVLGLRREGAKQHRDIVRSTSDQEAAKNSRQITRTLLVVSVVFLVLNVPYRSKQFAEGAFSVFIEDRLLALWVDFCSYTFLCFNYSVNFVFYALSGSRFRKSVAELFCKDR